MHARASSEAARRAKRGRQPSHARGHLRVWRFARRTTEKRETARSLKPRVISVPYMGNPEGNEKTDDGSAQIEY